MTSNPETAKCCGSPLSCGAHDPARYRRECVWPAPRRDWVLVYVREGDPAYWVAADGELRVPSDVPPREEWAPEMQDCQL